MNSIFLKLKFLLVFACFLASPLGAECAPSVCEYTSSVDPSPGIDSSAIVKARALAEGRMAYFGSLISELEGIKNGSTKDDPGLLFINSVLKNKIAQDGLNETLDFFVSYMGVYWMTLYNLNKSPAKAASYIKGFAEEVEDELTPRAKLSLKKTARASAKNASSFINEPYFFKELHTQLLSSIAKAPAEKKLYGFYTQHGPLLREEALKNLNTLKFFAATKTLTTELKERYRNTLEIVIMKEELTLPSPMGLKELELEETLACDFLRSNKGFLNQIFQFEIYDRFGKAAPDIRCTTELINQFLKREQAGSKAPMGRKEGPVTDHLASPPNKAEKPPTPSATPTEIRDIILARLEAEKNGITHTPALSHGEGKDEEDKINTWEFKDEKGRNVVLRLPAQQLAALPAPINHKDVYKLYDIFNSSSKDSYNKIKGLLLKFGTVIEGKSDHNRIEIRLNGKLAYGYFCRPHGSQENRMYDTDQRSISSAFKRVGIDFEVR